MEFFWDNDKHYNLSTNFDPSKVIEFPSIDINIEEFLENKSSFLHIPPLIALERIEKGNLVLNDITKIFQGRVEIEDREIGYSLKSSRINMAENEIQSSSLAIALSSLKNYFVSLHQEQNRVRHEIEQNISLDLTNYQGIHGNIIIKHRSDLNKITNLINNQSAQLIKVKQQYIKVLDEIQKETEKLLLSKKNLEFMKSQNDNDFNLNHHNNNNSNNSNSDKDNTSSLLYGRLLSVFDIQSSPEQEIERSSYRIEKLEKEMEKKHKEMEEKKYLLLSALEERDRVWITTLKAFETAEKSRLKHTERALKQFCQYERELLEKRLELLSRLEETTGNSLNSSQDLEGYVNKETVVDHTHLYSHAMKVMDWDYYRKTSHFPTEEAFDLEGSGVWIDSEGIPSEETLLSNSNSKSNNNNNNPNNNNNNNNNNMKDNSHNKKQDKDHIIEEEEEGEEIEKIGLLGENDETIEPLSSPIHVIEVKNDDSPISFEDTKPLEIPSSQYNPNNITVHEISSSPSVKDLSDIYLFPSTPSSKLQSENEFNQHHFIELCRRCFDEKDAREIFLQILDEKRGRNSLLTDEQYNKMKITMKVFLDKCQEYNDVKAALRIANMSITFHRIISNTLPVTSSTSSSSKKSQIHEANKCYLQREEEICHHHIWRGDQFWEESLIIGLESQLNMVEKVRWDELEAEALREKIIGIHNMIFGQLGALAFTMHQMGLPQKQVEKFIMSRSVGAQIGRDQQLDLLKSIRLSYEAKSFEKQNVNTNLKLEVKHEDEIKDDKKEEVKVEKIKDETNIQKEENKEKIEEEFNQQKQKQEEKQEQEEEQEEKEEEVRVVQTIAIESNEDIPRIDSNSHENDRDDLRTNNITNVREYL